MFSLRIHKRANGSQTSEREHDHTANQKVIAGAEAIPVMAGNRAESIQDRRRTRKGLGRGCRLWVGSRFHRARERNPFIGNFPESSSSSKRLRCPALVVLQMASELSQRNTPRLGRIGSGHLVEDFGRGLK